MSVQLQSRVHMIFGAHVPSHMANIRRITESIPKSKGKRLFIAELGAIHKTEFMIFHQGTAAARNADRCLATVEANEQLSRDVATFLETTMDRVIWKELKKRKVLRKGTRKRRKPKKAKQGVPKETFQLGLFLMAQQRGFELTTEMPSAEAILYRWKADAIDQDLLLYWANEPPGRFNFSELLDLAKLHYRYLQMHQLNRDNNFKDVLMSKAAEYECVVVQWGIAHKGFYERELPGVNMYTHSEPIFFEQFISDGITPESLSDVNLARLLKDFIYRPITTYSSLSHFEAAKLVDQIPDDLSELEKFYREYCLQFFTLRDPAAVFAQMIRALR